MHFLMLGRSVGWIEKKNLNKKKNDKKSQNRRPWYPRMTLKVNIHIFGLTKCPIYCKNVAVFYPIFLYAVTMLFFQIKRIFSSEKWFNYVVTFLCFCLLKIPKIWVGWTTLNGEKKGMPSLVYNILSIIPLHSQFENVHFC